MSNIENGIGFVLAKPHLFLPNGIFDPRAICGRMATQALMLGAMTVEMSHHGSWWALASDYNWLTESSGFSNPLVPFQQIISDGRLGQNSCFGEIVLSAFCESVVVFEKGNEILHIGAASNLPEEMLTWTDRDLGLFFRYPFDGNARIEVS